MKQTISSVSYHGMARNYEKLGQFCDAISAIEAWVANNPAQNDTSQTQAIIATYRSKAKCEFDTAISEGPGLRWALMGPHLTFHLAGGSGGMAHFLEQLGPPLESWWDDLGDPQLTPEVRQALTAGVSAEAEGRDIATLAAERDRFLVDLLALKGARRDA